MNDADDILREARNCFQDGRLDEAGTHCDAILAAYPDNLDAINLLGLVRLRQTQPLDALALFEGGLRLAPRSVSLLNNAGEALLALRRFEDAAGFFRHALKVEPANDKVLRNLGAALAEANRMAEALRHFAAAMQANPADKRNWANVGEAARRLGRFEEALGCFRRALAIDASFPPALRGMGLTLRDRGVVDEALPYLRRAVDADPDHPGTHQDLLLTLNLIDGMDTAEIVAAHRDWGARMGRLAGESATAAPDRNPQRRLRIGYLAPGFTDPDWAPLVLPILAAHSRADFEITCYATRQEAAEDTGRPPRGARRLRGLSGLTDWEAARQIAADRIDILVDLAGHLPGSRAGVLALRPAALILSWARYPVAPGLAAVAHRVTDRVIDPEATANPAADAAIRLPGGAFCWSHQGDPAPDPGPPPAAAAGHVTFGCRTSFARTSPQTIANWAAVLRRLPDARFLLSASGAQEGGVTEDGARRRIEDAFDLHGIESARIEVRPNPADGAGDDFWSDIEIALDTQPWNGLEATCSALWAGVPVVTMRGETPAGRIGASLLIHAGLSDLVAETRGRMVETAVSLARNTDRLTELRRTLREKVETSPLGRGDRLAGELESAYRRLWRRWSRAAPDPATPPAMAASPRAAGATSEAKPTEASDGRSDTAANPATRLVLGGAPRDGWTAADTPPGDALDDIGNWTALRSLADRSVAEVYAPTVLAHLSPGEPVLSLLKEIHRVLRPGGRLRVTVPDLEAIGSLPVQQGETEDANRSALNLLFGGPAPEAPFRAGMTWDAMRRLLSEAGFRRISRVSVFPDFPEESSRRVSGRPVTLNVEGIKTVGGRAVPTRMA